MMDPSGIRRWRALIAVLACGGALLAVLAATTWRPTRMLARRVQLQTETITDNHLESHVERLTGLGKPGTTALVELMTNRREAVARTAAVVLYRQSLEWSAQSTQESFESMAHAASELARHVDRMAPYERHEATEISLLMLYRRDHRSSVDRVQLIADCQTVLRAAAHSPSFRGNSPSTSLNPPRTVPESAGGVVPRPLTPPLARRVTRDEREARNE